MEGKRGSTQINNRYVKFNHHEVLAQGEVSTLFEYCNHLVFFHLLTVYQRKSIAVDLVEYLLYPEFSA